VCRFYVAACAGSTLLLVHEKSLIATPQEIHKYLPIQLEAGQI
jgi:hypothetical protein